MMRLNSKFKDDYNARQWPDKVTRAKSYIEYVAANNRFCRICICLSGSNNYSEALNLTVDIGFNTMRKAVNFYNEAEKDRLISLANKLSDKLPDFIQNNFLDGSFTKEVFYKLADKLGFNTSVGLR